jgi:two-component system, NarL family, sensor histidine kinase UhpB
VGAIDTLRGRPVRRRRTTLFRGLYTRYAVVLLIAAALLILTPFSVSEAITLWQFVVVLAGLALMLIAWLVLLRQALAPLASLTRLMRQVDPLAPGQRIDIGPAPDDVATLADAFNEMLDRLESERRDSARRALSAQEHERRRIARELHDEIGQTLTGLLLRSEALARRAPEALRADLTDLRDAARRGAEDAREIARRLRPEALDQLGLLSALEALAQRTPIEVDCDLEPDAELDAEEELVVYRVAQEGLTNVVRHSGAEHARLTMRAGARGVTLTVADDGIGIPPAAAEEGAGIRGMRERALLIGAQLTVAPRDQGGTLVRLEIPRRGPAA